MMRTEALVTQEELDSLLEDETRLFMYFDAYKEPVEDITVIEPGIVRYHAEFSIFTGIKTGGPIGLVTGSGFPITGDMWIDPVELTPGSTVVINLEVDYRKMP